MPLVRTFFEARGRGDFSILNLSLLLENAPAPDFGFRGDKTEEQRLDQWLEGTAYFHEMRHYHDLVGSVCGLHLFLEVTALVDRLFVALKEAKDSKLRVPLTTFHPDLAATQLYSSYHEFIKVILGDLPVLSTEQEYGRIPVQEYEIADPAVSTSYPLVPLNSRDHRTGKSYQRLVPVGLRALMEHTATETQVFLVSIGAGEDPNDPLDTHGRVRRAASVWGSLFRSEFLQYVIVQLLASYAKYGASGETSPTFLNITPPIGEILSVAQAAMDFSGYAGVVQASGPQWFFEHPGLVAGHLLASWAQHRTAQGLTGMIDRITGEVPQLGRPYSDFLSRYAESLARGPRGKMPRHLLPEAAAEPMIANLRELIFADHSALMQSKAADLEAWLLPPRYLETLHRLPAPPLRNVPGISAFSRDRDQVVCLLWWLFRLAFSEGVMAGKALVCPILSQAPRLGAQIVFSDPEKPGQDTNCLPFIASQSCGRFNGRFLPTQPECHFVSMIRRITNELGIDFQFTEAEDEQSQR